MKLKHDLYCLLSQSHITLICHIIHHFAFFFGCILVTKDAFIYKWKKMCLCMLKSDLAPLNCVMQLTCMPHTYPVLWALAANCKACNLNICLKHKQLSIQNKHPASPAGKQDSDIFLDSTKFREQVVSKFCLKHNPKVQQMIFST